MIGWLVTYFWILLIVFCLRGWQVITWAYGKIQHELEQRRQARQKGLPR